PGRWGRPRPAWPRSAPICVPRSAPAWTRPRPAAACWPTGPTHAGSTCGGARGPRPCARPWPGASMGPSGSSAGREAPVGLVRKQALIDNADSFASAGLRIVLCWIVAPGPWHSPWARARRNRIVKIAVIGTGYVGLVTGTCLAESGNDVICVDLVAEKIARLKQGVIPIYEPGLSELVHRNARDGRLRFTTNLPEGIAEAEPVFIAVGTPQGENGGADLRGIWAVGQEIAEHLDEPKIIVIKSTVP